MINLLISLHNTQKISGFFQGLRTGEGFFGLLGAGGDDGIRTHDTLLGYAHLANEYLQPLGHVSNGLQWAARCEADMPQLGALGKHICCCCG